MERPPARVSAVLKSSLLVILAILRKDLEDAVRSYTLLPMLLVPILLSLFSAYGLSDSDRLRPTLAVFDPGNSGLVRFLSSSAANVINLRPVASSEEGRSLLLQGKVGAVLAVPAGFDEGLASQKYLDVEVVVDDSRPTPGALCREAVKIAVREADGQKLPPVIRVEKIRKGDGGARQFLLPICVTWAVLSGLLIASTSMVEEKDTGTLEQMLCGPVTMGEVLAGKISASWLLGLGTAVLVLALNGGWRGLGGAGFLVLALGSLAFAGLGALIGLWSPSQATGSTIAGMAFSVLFFPGALAEVNRVMSRVAAWSPGWYFQDGVSRALLAGAGLTDLRLNLAVLAATTLAVFALGVWRLRQD